ncbi:MAG: rod shape-determining protein MreC [Lewinella sp.]|nr:rod shape-determining protein MreC [Lewinella sp.]
MNRLLQLLTRSGALFLFTALEIVCFYLIINFNSAQHEVAMETWSLYSNRLTERSAALRSYINLRQEVEQMQAENARLRGLLPNANYTEQVEVDSVQQDSLRQRFTYIPAEIINKSPIGANITYVINRGRIHGVEKHQGVISDQGVAGIVINVSERHARVMSLLHRDFRLSAGLHGKPYFGSLRWEGEDVRFATLFSIPEYADPMVGDTVETTGYSNKFPTGVPVGTIADVSPQEGSNTFIVKVKLFGDFYELQRAYVIRDLLKEDLEQLDQEE